MNEVCCSKFFSSHYLNRDTLQLWMSTYVLMQYIYTQSLIAVHCQSLTAKHNEVIQQSNQTIIMTFVRIESSQL